MNPQRLRATVMAFSVWLDLRPRSRPHEHLHTCSAPAVISHNIRGALAFSKCFCHFRQNHTSFTQCAAVNNGTSTESGSIANVAGFSWNIAAPMRYMSAVSLE